MVRKKASREISGRMKGTAVKMISRGVSNSLVMARIPALRTCSRRLFSYRAMRGNSYTTRPRAITARKIITTSSTVERTPVKTLVISSQ